MRKTRHALLIALGAQCLLATHATADKMPLWEAGLGVAAIDFPDYRGSDERQAYLLPMPYVVYRGDFLKVNRDGVRGMFFESERMELDVSVNGSVPVKSADNRARRGMPDLDPTLEIGPSLNLFLLRSPDRKRSLELRLPVRAVIASDFSHASHEGWVFQPNLNLDLRDVWPGEGWNLGVLAGPVFADRRYHQYIYGVAPAHATAQRPAYDAHGGYAGTQLVGALSKRFPNYWLGGFVKWDTLNGAAFADSPLLKMRQYFTAGIAVSWVFAESKIRVDADR